MQFDQDMLDVIAEHFRGALFNCTLPLATIRIDRTFPQLLGAYAGRHLSGSEVILFNDLTHAQEHPGFIAGCVTIAHEQCHQWAVAQDPQNYLNGGHSCAWFVRMHSIGLRSTWVQSRSGNRATRDTIIPDGPFMHEVLRLAGYFGATA